MDADFSEVKVEPSRTPSFTGPSAAPVKHLWLLTPLYPTLSPNRLYNAILCYSILCILSAQSAASWRSSSLSSTQHGSSLTVPPAAAPSTEVSGCRRRRRVSEGSKSFRLLAVHRAGQGQLWRRPQGFAASGRLRIPWSWWGALRRVSRKHA